MITVNRTLRPPSKISRLQSEVKHNRNSHVRTEKALASVFQCKTARQKALADVIQTLARHIVPGALYSDHDLGVLLQVSTALARAGKKP